MKKGQFYMCCHCCNYSNKKCLESVVRFEFLPITNATECLRIGKFKERMI